MKYVKNKSDLPIVPHYAVLRFSSIFIPGDERSRTHPGHGYPASSESVSEYITFSDTKELEEWVTKNEKEHFAILSVAVPEFKLEKKLKLTLSQ